LISTPGGIPSGIGTGGLSTRQHAAAATEVPISLRAELALR